MSFASKLREYRDELGCSNKAIADACGISASALSRYLNGSRTPESGSAALEKLAEGIARASEESGAGIALYAPSVRAALEAELSASDMVGMSFHMRLDAIMGIAGLSNVEIARVTGVNPSFVSRIRHGQRMPADVPGFARPSSHLAAHHCIEKNRLAELGALVEMPDIIGGHPYWDPTNESNIAEIIEVWLAGSQIVQADIAKLDELFTWLDNAELGRWLSIRHKPRSETPVKPASLARFYYGIGGMRTAEIDFLNMAAETHARNLCLSSDMPLMYLPPDSKFTRQFDRALMSVLEENCRINVFYSVERPLEETIHSLRMWIPLYITGQITPYYLKGVNNRLFFHMNYVCETCALSSEAVMGHEEDGRYYFTTRAEDVSYYIRKMEFILEKASSFLEIYRDCDPGQKEAFEESEARRRAKGRKRRLGEERFRNLEVVYYPDDCTVLSLPCGPTAVHFVIRHPKINYVVAHMK